MAAVAETIGAAVGNETQDAERRITALAALISDRLGIGTQEAETRLHALNSLIGDTLGSGTLDAEMRDAEPCSTLLRDSRHRHDRCRTAAVHARVNLAERIGTGTHDAEMRLRALSVQIPESLENSTADIERRLESLASGATNTLRAAPTTSNAGLPASLATTVESVHAGAQRGAAHARHGRAVERRRDSLQRAGCRAFARDARGRHPEAGDAQCRRDGAHAAGRQRRSRPQHERQDRGTDDDAQSAQRRALARSRREGRDVPWRLRHDQPHRSAATWRASRITARQGAGEPSTRRSLAKSAASPSRRWRPMDQKATGLARSIATNSEEIVRLITQAGSNASGSIGRVLAELEESSKVAIEKSQRTSTAAVAEMLETHSMLRNDTNALFERLREANVLLQEVLSGATENLGTIEGTLSTRVKDFVTALNEVGERSGSASAEVEKQIKSFHIGNDRRAQRRRRDGGPLRAAGRRPGQRRRQARRKPPQVGNRAGRASCGARRDRRHDRQQGRIARRALRPLLVDVQDTLERRRRRAPARSRAWSPMPAPKAPARSPRSTSRSAPSPTRSARARRKRCARCSRPPRRRPRRSTRARPARRAALFQQTAERFNKLVADMKSSAEVMQQGSRGDARAAAARHFRASGRHRREHRENAPRDRRADRCARRTQPHRRPPRAIDRCGADRAPRARERRRDTASSRSAREPRSAAARRSRCRRAAARRPPQLPHAQGGWLEELAARPHRPVDRAGAAAGTSRRPASTPSTNSRSTIPDCQSTTRPSLDFWERRRGGEQVKAVACALHASRASRTSRRCAASTAPTRTFREAVDRYVLEFERLLDEVSRDERRRRTRAQLPRSRRPARSTRAGPRGGTAG